MLHIKGYWNLIKGFLIGAIPAKLWFKEDYNRLECSPTILKSVQFLEAGWLEQLQPIQTWRSAVVVQMGGRDDQATSAGCKEPQQVQEG